MYSRIRFCLAAFVILSSAVSGFAAGKPIPEATGVNLDPVLGPGWTNLWILPATNKTVQYHIEADALTGTQALVSDSKAGVTLTSRCGVTSEVEIIFLVRPSKSAGDNGNPGANIIVAQDPANPKDKGLAVNIQAQGDDTVSVALSPLPANRFACSSTNQTGGRLDPVRSIRFELKAYPTVSPTLDPAVRASLERDMALLPASCDKWFQVRYQLGKDWIRIWVNDRVVADHVDPALRTHGIVSVALRGGARLGSCTVTPLTPPSPFFETIPLSGYAMDRNLCGTAKKPVGLKFDALPFGSTITIDKVPLALVDRTFAGGADHIDVGRSLVREANMQGYGPVKSEGNRVADAFTIDPSRIRMRIPNGRYSAAYVLAASDDEPDSIPLFSLQFFRPRAGFSMTFEGAAPSYKAEADPQATRVPVELENGKKASLWLIRVPLDPGRLSSFADMGTLELELTKKVEQYRSYPDPILYGWHGAGLPSGAHIYAVTLQRPDVDMEVNPAAFGHVWEAADPAYNFRLLNRTEKARRVTIAAETTSEDGQEKTSLKTELDVPAGQTATPSITVPVKLNGFHEARFTLADGEQLWTEVRSFAKLHKDTRDATWSGQGPLFGYWGYGGGHYTPPADATDRLMQMAGSRAPKHPANAWPVTPQHAWAGEDPLDPAKVAAYKTNVIADIKKRQNDNPEIITFFPEPHISRDLTAGNLATYWNQPEPPLTEEESRNLKVFFNTAKVAGEAVRAQWPNATLLIPWGDPLFIVPLLRAGFPKELIDGSGLDVPGFERLPEQQLHQISFHRLYCLREEYRKFGMPNPKLWFMEGTFVPTEPGACTWKEQADYHDRWALICMGYGVDRFYSGWFAFDCCNYYGTEHYGGCGIQRRIPYCNPKPAYTHYATMTRQLEHASWDKWLKTGSLSTFCIRFNRPAEKGGPVHVLWTLRGRRPVDLTLPAKGTLVVTDPNDNETRIESTANNTVTVMTGPSPIYVAGVDQLASVQVGEPDHSDSTDWSRTRNQQTWYTGPAGRNPEIMHEQPIALLGDGTWKIDEKPDVFDEIYEGNNFDTKRYRGRMSVTVATDTARPVASLAVKLEKQDKDIPLMPWYSVLRPEKPVTIPGHARALGLWTRAASDWGRVVYCLRDANDEMWISIGFKDQWNCDDAHSWSYFNFDGWRYVRFELPGHTPWDTFREYGTTWWRYAGGKKEGVGIVDLPLRLEKIIVERRTHILYVNDIQPTGAETNDVLLADLVAEYGSRVDATEEAVRIGRLRMPLPEEDTELPNPIREMASKNTLPATEVTGIRNPDWGYDGTVCHVDFKEMDGADEYQVWVSAHKDGRGAVQMAGKVKKSGVAVRNLAPAMKLYLWVTYTAAQSEEEKKAKTPPAQSKPSKVREIELVDAFGQK